MQGANHERHCRLLFSAPSTSFLQTFALTPEQGAQTSIHCTAAPDLPGGKYWDSCRPVASSAESYDQAVAARLWERSAELVGL